MVFQLKNVLISDEVDPRCVEILQENGIGVVKDTKLRLSKENFLKEIVVSDMLCARVCLSPDWSQLSKKKKKE